MGAAQLGSPYEGLSRRTRADCDEMNAQQAGLPGRDCRQAHQLCLKPALRLFDTSPVPVSLTEPVTLKGPPNSFCSALSVRSHLSSLLEMSAPNVDPAQEQSKLGTHVEPFRADR